MLALIDMLCNTCREVTIVTLQPIPRIFGRDPAACTRLHEFNEWLLVGLEGT